MGRWDTSDCHISTCCSCRLCCLPPSVRLSGDSVGLDVLQWTVLQRFYDCPTQLPIAFMIHCRAVRGTPVPFLSHC